MNCAKKLPSDLAAVRHWVAAQERCKYAKTNLHICITALQICSVLVLFGACTVAPKLARSSQASFDSGGQNSGILGVAGDDGFWVTPNFRDRYNALIATYGGKFLPPLTPNQGIYSTPTNTFIMGQMAMEHFETMNRWRKQAVPAWAK